MTGLSQSRARWRCSTPGKSVSRTQCRLHARGAEGEGVRPLLPHHVIVRNSPCYNQFAPSFTDRAFPGTRFADYRFESVRAGLAAFRLDGVARFARIIVIALKSAGE